MYALALGAVMPEFNLSEPATGRELSSKDLSPRSPAVVVFTANDCPHAQAWEERLLQLGRQYRGQVGMVMISSNDPERFPDCSPDAIAKRARERDYPVPYLFDADQSVALAFGAERTPDVFVFSEDRLVYHGTVDDNEEEPDQVKTSYLQDALAALLNGTPVPTAETSLIGCGIKWKPDSMGSIRYASLLMSRGTWSDQQLASILGYRDEPHFARRFNEVIGKTPTEFRAALTSTKGGPPPK